MAETTEPTGEPKGGAKEQFSEALRHVWWAGLGLLAVTGQEGERLFRTLVEKGRELEPNVYEQGRKAKAGFEDAMEDVGVRLKEVAETIGRSAGRAEVMVDEKVASALERMGFPTREEIRKLSEKMDELKARIDQMQQRQTS